MDNGAGLCIVDKDIPIHFKNTQMIAATAPGAHGPEFIDSKYISNPIHMNLLGPENTVTNCQFCRASIKTAVKYTTTTRTHMAAALWGLICCCCCVPYGCVSAKNTDHYCPACQRYLGTYEK